MTDSPASASAEKGLFSRAIGVIFSPGDTFRDVVRHPRPTGVLFIACLLIALSTGVPQLSERGRTAALDAQVQAIERFTGQPVTPEMYAQLEGQAHYGAYTAFGGTFIMLPVVTVVIAGVLWVVFNAVLGGTGTFKAVLAVVAHSQMIPAIGAVAAVPIQYAQGIQSMAGPFNLGALAPMLDPSGFLAMYLGGISVFTLWQIVVTAIGLSVLYGRRTGGVAVGLLVAYLVLAAVIAAVVSSFMHGT
jgi:hypothetical protein